ncbi:MAG: tRNA guanosine(34) transglycosylase Tgt [Solirubrobacterales bacterium]|nr:tRNA guanosine(34) transglycosylase Tgt [Solirubrobacterales bacterium]
MSERFEIQARSSGSQARSGVLHLHNGDLRTPAFVPLATKGTIKSLTPREVSDLGFEMVLGNTFHLMLQPGADRIADFDGLGNFMRWPGPIITDSGGFQVFSMGHGTVADEVKGRSSNGAARQGSIIGIDEEGVRFRSYIDGSKMFMGPETSMEVQAKLGSDIALVFDECTPFHVTRDYTAKSTERTHRWLDRCLSWHKENGPDWQMVYGIVQGGVYEDMRRESAAAVASRNPDGIAIGGSLGENKPQMYEVVSWATDELDKTAPDSPRHLLGIGDVDDLIRGVELGIDTFDCAMPTRIGRHGTAVVADPSKRWRLDLTHATGREDKNILVDGCGCPACADGYSRAYIHHLLRAKEHTAMRLLTLHNLFFIARLMDVLRDAVANDTLPAAAAALRAGAAPWEV